MSENNNQKKAEKMYQFLDSYKSDWISYPFTLESRQKWYMQTIVVNCAFDNWSYSHLS